MFATSQVGPIDGLVYPSAEFGHSRVDSWKLSISTAIAPGDHSIDTPSTHQRPTRVSLQGKHHTLYLSYLVTVYLMENITKAAERSSMIGVTGYTKLCYDMSAMSGHYFVVDQKALKNTKVRFILTPYHSQNVILFRTMNWTIMSRICPLDQNKSVISELVLHSKTYMDYFTVNINISHNSQYMSSVSTFIILIQFLNNVFIHIFFVVNLSQTLGGNIILFVPI